MCSIPINMTNIYNIYNIVIHLLYTKRSKFPSICKTKHSVYFVLELKTNIWLSNGTKLSKPLLLLHIWMLWYCQREHSFVISVNLKLENMQPFPQKIIFVFVPDHPNFSLISPTYLCTTRKRTPTLPISISLRGHMCQSTNCVSS